MGPGFVAEIWDEEGNEGETPSLHDISAAASIGSTVSRADRLPQLVDPGADSQVSDSKVPASKVSDPDVVESNCVIDQHTRASSSHPSPHHRPARASIIID